MKKHPLAIRWFHWINFPLLTIMIISGLMIYWASSNAQFRGGVYRIGFGDFTLVHFFPDWFWRAIGLKQRLAQGMSWHFFFMWFFTINGIAYVIYTAISGQWRHLLPRRGDFKGAFEVLLHDLRIRKTLPNFPHYNPAQRIAYTLVILMGAGSVITGLAIYKPVKVGWLTTMLGGYEWARWEHFWLTMGYVGFFVIHIVQVIRAGWRNFRSMVIGYDLETVKETDEQPVAKS